MLLNTWSEVLQLSFQNLWVGVVNFVPNLVIAIVILVLGWLIGALLGRAIAQVFKSLKVDEGLRRAGLESFLRRGGVNLDSGEFIGALVKWFVIVMFLVAAFDILGLVQVNLFLQEVVLGYLPGVLAAHFAGAIAKWAIWIFAILVALSQLGIAAAFSQTLFTGIVIALSLALGLSFGLGGQEAAGRFIERLRGEMSGRNQ